MKIFKPNRGKGFVKGNERVGEITTISMSDDFTGNDGDSPNPTKWTVVDESIGYVSTLNIQNNKLEFYSQGTGWLPLKGWIYVESEYIAGDFDFSVNIYIEIMAQSLSNRFQILNPATGIIIQFQWQYGKYIAILSTPYGSPSAFVDTADTDEFRLRIARINGLITFWYWSFINERWEWDGNIAGFTPTLIIDDPLIVRLKSAVWGSGFTEAKSQWDNFIGPAIGVESNRAMYVFDREAQPKVFKSFNKKVRRPKIWR